MSVLPLTRERPVLPWRGEADRPVEPGYAGRLVRVLICNETTLVRDGLRTLLEAEPDIEVIETTDSGLHAIILARTHRPHVVVTGLALHTIAGVELIRRLRREEVDPAPRAIAFITNEDDDTLADVLHAGACGVLTRDTGRDELLGAIRAVADGQAMLPPPITQRLLVWFRAHGARPERLLEPVLAELTQREREVLLLTARGMSPKEIGSELSIAVATVRTHVYRVRHKLQLNDRAQLVSFAYRAGLISPA
jgi:DNA-binding NarL/FixJ family response regulator